MRLSRWSVENYRSIGSVEFEVDSLSVLIGKNNSGKSNITEAIVKYFEIADGRRYDRLRWANNVVRERESDREIVFDVTFTLNSEEIEKVVEDLAQDDYFDLARQKLLSEEDSLKIRHRVVIQDETAVREDFSYGFGNKWVLYRYRDPEAPSQTKQVHSDGPDPYYRIPERTFYHVGLGDDSQNKGQELGIGNLIPEPCRSWISDFGSSIENIGAIRRPKSRTSVQVNTELKEDAENLANVLHTLSQNQRGKYKRISERYVSIMEGVTDVLTPISSSSSRPVTDIEVVEEDVSYTLEEISSGSMEILALLTKLILSEDNTSLLVIEEPEIHLHPEAEREVFELMQEVSNQAPQILIATHSDVFVNASEANQIIKVVRDLSTECKKIDQVDRELEDLGYSKSDFLQSNAVVFVEGKSDERVIKNLAQKSGFDPVERGIHFVELDGEGNIHSDGRSLVKLLYSFGIPYLFVADSHDMDPNELTDKIVEEINNRDGEWYTTPENFAVLSGYGIEDYLIEMPSAIASVVGSTTDAICSDIENINTEDSAEVLNAIFQNHLNTGYNKAEHGMLIAKHADNSAIPGEMCDLIDRIRNLPESKPT